MFEYDEFRLGALEKRVAFRKQSARDKHVAADVGRLVVARKLADDVARARRGIWPGNSIAGRRDRLGRAIICTSSVS